MIIKTIQSVDVGDFNELVERTYGRTYDFQQQDGCRDRGVVYINVPDLYADDYDNEAISEEVNGTEMGVSFRAWFARDPKQKLDTENEWDREHGLNLFWRKNFYPHISMVANDLHALGLLPAGKLQIVIDW